MLQKLPQSNAANEAEEACVVPRSAAVPPGWHRRAPRGAAAAWRRRDGRARWMKALNEGAEQRGRGGNPSAVCKWTLSLSECRSLIPHNPLHKH